MTKVYVLVIILSGLLMTSFIAQEGVSSNPKACLEYKLGCPPKKEAVFKSRKEFLKSPDIDCIVSTKGLDFEKYTLLGSRSSGSGKPKFEFSIRYDSDLKTYYHHTIITSPAHIVNNKKFTYANLASYSHWCLIPKLNSEQKVIFTKEKVWKEIVLEGVK